MPPRVDRGRAFARRASSSPRARASTAAVGNSEDAGAFVPRRRPRRRREEVDDDDEANAARDCVVGVSRASTSTAARDEGFEMCAKGFVPVIHGDVVRDAVQGTSVLSGDDIVAWCARWVAEADATAPPPRVVFCSDVFGVYAGPPKTSVVVDSDEYDVPLRVSEDEDAVGPENPLRGGSAPPVAA